MWLTYSFAVFLACYAFAVSSALAAEDPEKGKALFEHCAACHSLESGTSEVGPSLHGLFGRRAASEDFNYSPAMRRANIIWTPNCSTPISRIRRAVFSAALECRSPACRTRRRVRTLLPI